MGSRDYRGTIKTWNRDRIVIVEFMERICIKVEQNGTRVWIDDYVT